MAFTFTASSQKRLESSVLHDHGKASDIHTVLTYDMIPNIDLDKLLGRKSKQYYGINGEACNLIWKARKAHGANESKESVRTYVSAIWKYGVAPFLSEDDEGNLNYDENALKEANAKWLTGELSVSKAKKKSAKRGDQAKMTPADKFLKWFDGMSATNQSAFLDSTAGKRITSLTTK